MTIRIGINPLTWTNDDLPDLGGEIPLETCLTEAKQAGYAGMELGHKFPRTPEKLDPLMKSYGLEVVSGWYSSNLLERTVEAEIDALEPHLHLLKSVGSKVLSRPIDRANSRRARSPSQRWGVWVTPSIRLAVW